jgi:hypothetical protein
MTLDRAKVCVWRPDTRKGALGLAAVTPPTLPHPPEFAGGRMDHSPESRRRLGHDWRNFIGVRRYRTTDIGVLRLVDFTNEAGAPRPQSMEDSAGRRRCVRLILTSFGSVRSRRQRGAERMAT